MKEAKASKATRSTVKARTVFVTLFATFALSTYAEDVLVHLQTPGTREKLRVTLRESNDVR